MEEGGKLYSWGINSSGELGLGDNKNRDSPYPIVYLYDKGFVSIKAIACGHNYAFVAGKEIKTFKS